MPNLSNLFLDFLRNASNDDLHDYRESQKKKRLPELEGPNPFRSLGPLLPPGDIHRGAAAREIYGQQPPATPTTSGTSSYVPDDYATTRPRVADMPPPPVSQPIDELEQLRRRKRQLSDPTASDFEPVVNQDKGWKGRIGDILKQFIISGGQNFASTANSKLTPAERLAGAVGGGIAGGVYGGVHPEVDEERERMFDVARLTDKEKELIATQEQQAKDFKARQEAAARAQGLTLNQPVAAIDPITGQTVFVKGSEAYSQGNQLLRQETGFQHSIGQQQRRKIFREPRIRKLGRTTTTSPKQTSPMPNSVSI